MREAFESLAKSNPYGLVRMRILAPFAPYLAGALAGFPPEEAERLYGLNAAAPADEDGHPLELTGIKKAPAALPKQEKRVEIPVNWMQDHHLAKVTLAKKITGTPELSLNREQAEEIIRGELERRELEDA